MNTFGRIIGLGLQIFGFLLIVNDSPNPLEYTPWFGSFAAEKIAGILIAGAGVLMYLYNYGEYSLIKYGFRK